MKRIAFGVILLSLAASPVFAQGRGRGPGKVPPGHLPPPGECRVWYDGVPPGQQPRPTSCREAERIASRSRNARVIYGDDRGRYSDRGAYSDPWYGDRGRDDRSERRDDRARGDRRNDRGSTSGRAVPRGERYPGDYSYPDRYPDRDRRLGSVAAQNGYRDGLNKGREDVDDGDRFDPNRHSWYRSGDRGYNSRYGSREQYRADYREGFLRGYEEAWR